MEPFNLVDLDKGSIGILCIAALFLIGLVLIFSYRTVKSYLMGRFSDSKNQITNYYNNTVEEIIDLEEQIADFVETHNEQIADSFYQEISKEFNRIERKIDNAKLLVNTMNKQVVGILFEKKSENALFSIEELRTSVSRLLSIRTRLFLDEEEVSYQKRQKERMKDHEASSWIPTRQKSVSYFADCSNKREITKKYRFLVKQFHPDNGGDSDEFQKIKEQYQKAIKGGRL